VQSVPYSRAEIRNLTKHRCPPSASMIRALTAWVWWGSEVSRAIPQPTYVAVSLPICWMIRH